MERTLINRTRLGICVAVGALIVLSKLTIGITIANIAMLRLTHTIVQTGKPVYIAGFPVSDILPSESANLDLVNWFKIASIINPAQSALVGVGPCRNG